MNTGYFDTLDSNGILSGWFVTSDTVGQPTNALGDLFMVRQGSTLIGAGRRTVERPDVEERFGIKNAGFLLRIFPLRKLDPKEPLNILLPNAAGPIPTNIFHPSEEFLNSELGNLRAATRNAKIFESILESELVEVEYVRNRAMETQSPHVVLLYYLSMLDEWAERPSSFVDPEYVSLQSEASGMARVAPLENLFDSGHRLLAANYTFDPVYVANLLRTPTGSNAPNGGQLLGQWLRFARSGQLYRPCTLVRGSFGPDGIFAGSKKELARLMRLLEDLILGSASFETLSELMPIFDSEWLRAQPLKASESGSGILRRVITQRRPVAPNAYFSTDRAALKNFEDACQRVDIGENVSLAALNGSLNSNVMPLSFAAGAFDPEQPLALLREKAAWGPQNPDLTYLEQFLPGIAKFASKKYPHLSFGLFYALYLRLMGIPANLRDTELTRPQQKLNLPRLRALGEIDSTKPIKASLIIPTLGRLDLLFEVLSSLALSSSTVNAEVIVSDDGSGLDLSVLSFFFPAVRILTASRNRGFLLNVNNAAAKARGEYIVLVNNDVIAHRRALDEMVETLESSEQIGVAGGMVLASDGSVQECGGAIWNDGTAWNLFRGHEEGGGLPRNVKDADYVSGCWMGIRRSVWDSVQGFSTEFVPAYCEDMDFCLKVRKQGLRVVVNPHSRVTHLEGASMGIDTNSKNDGKRFQVINQQRAFEKWRTTLQFTYEPNGRLSRQFRGSKALLPVALIFDHYCPEPDRDAGSKTVFDLVATIAESGMYYPIFVPQNGHYSKYAVALERLGVEVIHGSGWERLEKLLTHHGRDIKLVLCSRLPVAKHFSWHIQKAHGKKIVYIHDVEEVRHATGMGTGTPENLPSLYRRHVGAWKDTYALFDHVLTCSDEESHQLSRFLSVPTSAMSPYTIPSNPAPMPPPGCEMLFVGSFNHHPNLSGVEWFVSQVFPRIREQMPNARIHVAGSGFDAAHWLDREGVVLHGPVSEMTLKFLYSMVTFAVAPLLEGAGMKGKVVEAFAHGRACIGTEIAYQGLSSVLSELPEPTARQFSGTPASLAQRIVKYASAAPVAPEALVRALGATLGEKAPGVALAELMPS
jgi:GT2 family glycosyltransferase